MLKVNATIDINYFQILFVFSYDQGSTATGTVPTIPSKYFTVVTDNSEKRGFQKSSRRFTNENVSRIINYILFELLIFKYFGKTIRLKKFFEVFITVIILTLCEPFRYRPSVQCTVIVHREYTHGERRGL